MKRKRATLPTQPKEDVARFRVVDEEGKPMFPPGPGVPEQEAQRLSDKFVIPTTIQPVERPNGE